VPIRAVPDFGSSSGGNPAVFLNPAKIWLWWIFGRIWKTT